MRSNIKEIRVIAGAVLFGISLIIPPFSSHAQPASVSVETYPTIVAHDGGSGSTGTPFAIFVRVSDWKQHAGETAYIRVHEAVGSWSNYYHHTADGTWSRAAGYAPDHYPILQLDGSGNAEGWIVLKSPSDKNFSTFTVRAKAGGSSGSHIDLGINHVVALLDMASAGAWIKADASTGMSGKAVLAIGSDQRILGVYLIENNGVPEGYAPTPGYFRMAVPANTSIPKIQVRNNNHTVASIQTSSNWSSGAPGTETDLDLHDEVSLPVGMASLSATWSEGKAFIRWKTESESEILGFHVWRSEAFDGEFRRISPEMILTKGEDGTGAEYTCTDGHIGRKQFWYRLEEIFFSGESMFFGPVQAIPESRGQTQQPQGDCSNYPNPFHPSTMIRYLVPEEEDGTTSTVKVFDVSGRELVTLDAAVGSSGERYVLWDGCDKMGREVAGGVYICCIYRDTRIVDTMRLLKAR